MALPSSLVVLRPSIDRDLQQQAEVCSQSDEELLSRVTAHDDDALLALFHRYYRLAYSIANRVLKDQGEGEDLVQEIFLRLYSRQHSFDSSRGTARTWLIQMFYRRALDRRAYLTRRQFYGASILEEREATDAENLEECLVSRITAQQLKSAFRELPEKQQQTLNLYFWEGLKLSAIAEKTGDSVQNVRHHYYRGLDKLRQLKQRESATYDTK